VFCALHDQLASLGRHAQLTRCFSAVAELLVDDVILLNYGYIRDKVATLSEIAQNFDVMGCQIFEGGTNLHSGHFEKQEQEEQR